MQNPACFRGFEQWSPGVVQAPQDAKMATRLHLCAPKADGVQSLSHLDLSTRAGLAVLRAWMMHLLRLFDLAMISAEGVPRVCSLCNFVFVLLLGFPWWHLVSSSFPCVLAFTKQDRRVVTDTSFSCSSHHRKSNLDASLYETRVPFFIAAMANATHPRSSAMFLHVRIGRDRRQPKAILIFHQRCSVASRAARVQSVVQNTHAAKRNASLVRLKEQMYNFHARPFLMHCGADFDFPTTTPQCPARQEQNKDCGTSTRS